MKKYFLIWILCITTFVFISTPAVQANDKVINWGVFHEKPGEIPIGEATDEYLNKYDTIFHANSCKEKELYLTFDAGYEDGNTEKMLDTLKERGVPAAFFVTGSYVKRNEGMINRMVKEGHIVCNHTMTHPDMTKADSTMFNSELKAVEDLYRSATGREMPKYYRPPRGTFNEKNLVDAKASGYKTILWSIAYKDWQKEQPSHSEAFKRILPNLHPGAILLLHTTSTTNVAVLPELIDKCREFGYEFKGLDQLRWAAAHNPTFG